MIGVLPTSLLSLVVSTAARAPPQLVFNSAHMQHLAHHGPTVWEGLGPFPLGMRELPLISGVPYNPSLTFQDFTTLDFGSNGTSNELGWGSPLCVDGRASWKRFRKEEDSDWVEISWDDVDWDQVRQVEGWAALQHLTILRSTFKTPASLSKASPPSSDGTEELMNLYSVDLTQAASFAIFPTQQTSPEPLSFYNGDLYVQSPSPGQGHLLHLKPSTEYTVLVKAIYEVRMFGGFPAGGNPKTRFQLSIRKVAEEEEGDAQVFSDALTGFPDIVDGWFWGQVAGISVRNLGTSGTKLLGGSVVGEFEGLTITVAEEDGLLVASLQTRPILLSIKQTRPLRTTVTSINITLTFPRYTRTISIPLNHRSLSSESLTKAAPPAIKITYMDADKTAQYAMVVPPKALYTSLCTSQPSNWEPMAVILAAHGAGVEASSPFWTKSIPAQPHSWIVFPTGKTMWGYDWRSSSALNAISVREQLEAAISAFSGKNMKVGTETVLVGHSNGGQGAMHIAQRFPDKFVAVIAAAGYSKLQAYVPFTQYVSSRSADPSLMGLLQCALSSFDNDIAASNVANMPAMLVHGREDDNVPVWHSRVMKDLIRGWKRENVTIHETPNESHWFDKVLSDDTVLPFLQSTLSIKKSDQITSCLVTKGFTLSLVNPDEQGSLCGFKILELEVPGRLSRLSVSPLFSISNSSSPFAIKVKASNVRKFSISLASISMYLRHSSNTLPTVSANTLQIHINHQIIFHSLDTTMLSETGEVVYQADSDGEFSLVDCLNSSPSRDTPPPPFSTTAGTPILSILNSAGPLTIVIPSSPTSGRHESIARRIAHDAFIYGRLDSQIINSTEAKHQMISYQSRSTSSSSIGGNWIIIGGCENSDLLNLLPHTSSLRFLSPQVFMFNKRTYPLNVDDTSLSLLTLLPHPVEGKKVLLLHGTDEKALERGFELIPVRTGTAIPSYIILKNNRTEGGGDGASDVLAAGFFNNDWSVSPAMSWQL